MAMEWTYDTGALSDDDTPPPPPLPKPSPPRISRYRSLRGKSISMPKKKMLDDFEIFEDDGSASDSKKGDLDIHAGDDNNSTKKKELQNDATDKNFSGGLKTRGLSSFWSRQIDGSPSLRSKKSRNFDEDEPPLPPIPTSVFKPRSPNISLFPLSRSVSRRKKSLGKLETSEPFPQLAAAEDVPLPPTPALITPFSPGPAETLVEQSRGDDEASQPFGSVVEQAYADTAQSDAMHASNYPLGNKILQQQIRNRYVSRKHFHERRQAAAMLKLDLDLDERSGGGGKGDEILFSDQTTPPMAAATPGPGGGISAIDAAAGYANVGIAATDSPNTPGTWTIPVTPALDSTSDAQRIPVASHLNFPASNKSRETLVATTSASCNNHHLQEEKDRIEAARWASEVARLEAETDRILAEQKKRDLARLQAQLATVPDPPSQPLKAKSSIILEKLSFLAKGKTSRLAATTTATKTRKISIQSRTTSQQEPEATSPLTLEPPFFSLDETSWLPNPIDRPHSPQQSPRCSAEMSFIEMGGGGVVPQTDAPKDAVNGGERRVTVRCLSSTLNLPVSPETSPVDIIYSTANLTSHHVNIETSIIIECYVILGLERRLRRYERIRDVMNSWDRDQQCSLLVLSYDNPPDDKDLNISSVPQTDEAPSGFSFHIYVSSRPGKWAKRWVTLLENGQMFSSKKPDGKPSDKDSHALCHLSDFDIYTPRESSMRRHLKPPKKFCYAIKSQQKTVVFPEGENFVHFFSTEDPAQAAKFHDQVHAWRSWYLVNKRVDISEKDAARDTGAIRSSREQNRNTLAQTPYTIGEFQPLIDMERFDKPLEEFGKDIEPETPAGKLSSPKSSKSPGTSSGVSRHGTVKKGVPPMPLPFTIPNPFPPKEEFDTKGLLGAGYEKRKLGEQQAAADTGKKTDDGPFTGGASLLNKMSITSPRSPPEKKASDNKPWFPSATEHSARSRTEFPSQTLLGRRATTSRNVAAREKGQPLLSFEERSSAQQPRVWREDQVRVQGQGVRPPANGGSLINFATGGTGPHQGREAAAGPPRGFQRVNTGDNSAPSARRDRSVEARQRSRSASGNNGRRIASDSKQPPVPPLPGKSSRGEPPRGREPRRQEPLINRAG